MNMIISDIENRVSRSEAQQSLALTDSLLNLCAEEAARDQPASEPVKWPRQVDLFGVPVSPTTYEEATESIIAAARRRQGGLVSCHAVHAIVTFSADPELRSRIQKFDMITPDGQPVRWALNTLHGTRLSSRVYGPELTLRVCHAAAEAGVSLYLYGGTPETLRKLSENLAKQFPKLQIAGSTSPPFRPLTSAEDADVVSRINQSGAGILLIGLGCPKQDLFAFEHRESVHAVQMCVGAAFDFHSGAKPKAPEWMQRLGLEWIFRLSCEPGRLWKRYLVTNTIFLAKWIYASLNISRVARQRAETHTRCQSGTS